MTVSVNIRACLLLFGLFALPASASQFYVVVEEGYIRNTINDHEIENNSYKVGLGYHVADKWYLEAGYQMLADDNISMSSPSGMQDQLNAKAFYLSALGKATGRSGELFYRVGILNVDIQSFANSNGECTSAPEENVCVVSESMVAANIGLGYDYYLTSSLMLRAEVEYIKGQSDYSANAIYVGFRVNF